MKFGGAVGITEMAYLTWTDGNYSYAELVEEAHLEAFRDLIEMADAA